MTDKLTTQTSCSSADSSSTSGTCCVDTYRIYDSCIGQECLRGLRVCLTDLGQLILNSANAVRIVDLKVLWVRILSEEVPFRTGYYNINLRYYFAVTLEVCLGLGNSSTIRGLACYDKGAILYGGEGAVSVFTSDSHQSFCFSPPDFNHVHHSTNAPRIVVEVASPIGLEVALSDAETDNTCEMCDIPEELAAYFEGSFENEVLIEKAAYITVGIFSLIRVERPAQLMLTDCESCFPDKTCDGIATFSDACSLFNSMTFPYSDFAPTPAGSTVDLTTERASEDPTVDPTLYR